MIVQEAISLIQNEYIKSNSKFFWADLGCGSGLFTHALASLLNEESIVYAIDKNISTFKKNISIKGAAIKLTEADFEKDNLPLTGLNGIMMANSLHFVKDKKSFLKKVKGYLNKNRFFLIVEYDTEVSNHWVPYPVSFIKLKELFNNTGYKTVTKINERTSVYSRGNLYSAIIN